jgi:hypothetical protein
LPFAFFILHDVARRFGVVGFGDGSIECDVAEVADMGMIELEYLFEVSLEDIQVLMEG